MKDIKTYVQERKAIIKNKVSELEKKPSFAIIQVGNVEASNRYVRNKIKDCEEVGIKTELIKLPETATTSDIISQIQSFNMSDITAYMIQLPLPSYIDIDTIKECIDPNKDADGFTDDTYVKPCTPMGIINFLERNDYNFEDKNALVIGRSNIVGKPMAHLLLERNANVTVLHSHTSCQSLCAHLNTADLVICATGKIATVRKEYLTGLPTRHQIVFDVGINFDENGKLIGDCDRNLPVQWQSPVPGGVGLLTRLQLLENILQLY